MVTKKPVVRKRLVPDPGAVSPMSRAVSVALTILETTKLSSWRALSEAVRHGEPKTNIDLLTLDIDPGTAALLAEQVSVLDLIRFGPGAGGKKPTTTTVLTCAVCARWLISTPISGTPTCVLTTGCTGKLVSAKKATKVGPDTSEGNEQRVDRSAEPATTESVTPELAAAEPAASKSGPSESVMEPQFPIPVETPSTAQPQAATAALPAVQSARAEEFTEGPGLFD